jgi:restriction endonuclease Mrr
LIKIEAYCTITADHELKIHNRKRLIEDLRECMPCEVVMTIKKRGAVSTPQRGYYFAVIVQEVRLRLKEFGYRLTNDETHEMLKLKFNPEHLHDADGTVIATRPGSTTEFNKTMMAEYMDAIIQWAQETLNLSIPPPDKSLTMNF